MHEEFLERVEELYIAYYQRPAEPSGLVYWSQRLADEGGRIEGIIQEFANSPESRTLYGGLDTSEILTAIYQAAFNRDPDPEGLKFYSEKIDSGEYSLTDVMLRVLDGAKGLDGILLDKKIDASLEFAQQIDPGLDGKWYNYLYMGREDADNARVWLHDTIDDPYSPPPTEEEIYQAVKETVGRGEEGKANYSTGDLPTPDDFPARALDSGYHWSGETITYSFNETIPPEYYTNFSFVNGWEPLDSEDREIVREVFSKLDDFLAVDFVEVRDNGDIRYNKADTGDADGFTWVGDERDPISGDVWINTADYIEGESPGSFRYDTYVHETGHAMGLKHPFEGYPILDEDTENGLYTIMSYTSKEYLVFDFYVDQYGMNYSTSDSAYPDDYQLYDVMALQAFYGADTTTRTGDDSYELSSLYDDHRHEVIWDAGGTDILDLSSTTHTNIVDMGSGTLSSVDVHSIETQKTEAIEKFVESGFSRSDAESFVNEAFNSVDPETVYTGIDNLGIAEGAIIEGLITGSGDDYIFGNEYNNVIFTMDGDDTVYITSTNISDIIDGGEGYDVVDISWADSSDFIIFESVEDDWYMKSEEYGLFIELIGVESVVMSDTSFDLA